MVKTFSPRKQARPGVFQPHRPHRRDDRRIDQRMARFRAALLAQARAVTLTAGASWTSADWAAPRCAGLGDESLRVDQEAGPVRGPPQMVTTLSCRREERQSRPRPRHPRLRWRWPRSTRGRDRGPRSSSRSGSTRTPCHRTGPAGRLHGADPWLEVHVGAPSALPATAAPQGRSADEERVPRDRPDAPVGGDERDLDVGRSAVRRRCPGRGREDRRGTLVIPDPISILPSASRLNAKLQDRMGRG